MSPFIRKLEHGAPLTDEDRRELDDACRNVHRIAGRVDLSREGEAPSNVHLILDGYACRYKVLPDGARQIMAVFVPGDICDLHVHILRQMDHNIATLVTSDIVELPPSTIEKLTQNPRINRALWWATLTDEGTLREWLVNMGQRPADRQAAHLFCELLVRLKAIGLAQGNEFRMPFTQQELADALGITHVHTNRVLSHLRDQDLIRVQGRRLYIPHTERLESYCDFDPKYLHLRNAGGTISQDTVQLMTA
jgi:CRP-like cAMP-binding protein